MKLKGKFAAKKVSFAFWKKKKKHWDSAVQFTIISTPFIQASTTLKEAFGTAAKSPSDNLLETDVSEPSKKKAKIIGPVCNAAASCDSKATHKNESMKTFFCKEHYKLLSKPAKNAWLK